MHYYQAIYLFIFFFGSWNFKHKIRFAIFGKHKILWAGIEQEPFTLLIQICKDRQIKKQWSCFRLNSRMNDRSVISTVTFWLTLLTLFCFFFFNFPNIPWNCQCYEPKTFFVICMCFKKETLVRNRLRRKKIKEIIICMVH